MPLPLLSSGHRLVGAYAALPAVAGASFLPISFLGRLPITMTPLAVLTFAASSTGSFASAGLATTATAVGTGVGAPVLGRLADRYGQRPVLIIAVLVNSLALTGLALRPGPGRPALVGLCLLIGVSMPPVGGMARARWLALSRRHADTAMAFEGTADELAYVLGPAAAGAMASLAGPPAALLAAAVTGLLAVGAFAAHPTHRVTGPASGAAPILEPGRPGPAAGSGLLVLIPAMVLMGAFFAAGQTAVTAFVVEAGQPTVGGLIYAVMAIGSAVTALATVALPVRWRPWLRCTVAATGLLAGVGLMAAADSILQLSAAVLVTGVSVGPILVTLHQLAGAVAPVGRAASTMAYLSAGSVTGTAIGATGAGILADADGGPGAFAVAAAACTALLLLSLTRLRQPSGPSQHPLGR
jgi:MFS family permease